MTVEKLKKLENVIKPILENKPHTREDDYFLYAEVIKVYDPQLLELSARAFLLGHNVFKLPNIKSVERARRKIQEKYPHLASERAKKKRAKEQQAYIQYATDKT